MPMNPFEQKPIPIDDTFFDWRAVYPKPYDKNEVDPYTKVRCILANGAEYEAVWFSHQFHRHCVNNDVRRDLAVIRKNEQQQQKKIACIKPINETILENTISYEQLAVDLTAIFAQSEPDPYVKRALDFALLEDFDHLYRYADLLDYEQGIRADHLVGNYTEITPGRPTIAEHRYPVDDVKRRVDYSTCDPVTKLHVSIITAAEQQTMNYYMNQAGFYFSDLGRRLYQEIALIEEQHVTQYGSLLDVTVPWAECLLNHEYAECYLYYSLYQDETEPSVKKIWEECFVQEISHLHKAVEILKKFEGKDYSEVIPDGEFPEPIRFSPQKDYIREVLHDTVTLTGDRENWRTVNAMPDDSKFFFFQRKTHGKEESVPSHEIIRLYIEESGKDYRYEDSGNPVPELQDRRQDNVTLARVKEKVPV